MSIRDIKSLIKIIEYKISLGLNLDSSICEEFENKNKHTNYIFSKGIDFVYEFFNIENNINNGLSARFIELLANNKIANKFFFEVCTSTKKGRLPSIIKIIATKRILSLLKKAKELS